MTFSTVTRLLMLATMVASITSAGEPPAIAPKIETDKAQTAQLIREYILANPEVLLQSLENFQSRQKAAQEQKVRESVVSQRNNLVNDGASPAVGPKDGITVVEFFDYRCGYCRKVDPIVAKLIEENPKVRVIYKELPILGPDSMTAAKASLAASKQGAFLKFHQALISVTEPITPQVVERVAGELGLDYSRLKADMESPETDEAIVRNRDLAEALNIRATPTFVIGSELIPGAVDSATLGALVAKAGTE